MEAIAGLTEHPADIMRDWEELLSRARDVRYGKSSEAASNDEPESAQRSAKWSQVIPLQGHDYIIASISSNSPRWAIPSRDLPSLVTRSGRGYVWKIRGYAQGDDAYYYAFYAHHESAAVSVGAMSLMVADFRPRSYKGQYSRRDLPPGGGWELAHRRVEWYEKLPTRYLNRVALLDLDNTLRKGWTILSLTNSESFQDFEGINELRHDVHSALKRYENRDTDHDSFATETAQSYARFAAVSTTRALEQAASAYVHLELKSTLFAFAHPLVELLRNHDVAPILVTGAPLELGVKLLPSSKLKRCTRSK